MKVTKNDILFVIAVLFALWFSAIGWIWFYYANLLYALPFGIAALLIWRWFRKDGKKRNKVIPVLLIAGVVASLGYLLYIWWSQKN